MKLTFLSMVSLVVFALAAIGASCTPSPIPPPWAEAGAVDSGVAVADVAPVPESGPPAPAPGSPCAEACVALSKAGCSLGAQPTCVRFMSDLSGQIKPGGSTLTCADVAGVKTRLDAQKLGFVCP